MEDFVYDPGENPRHLTTVEEKPWVDPLTLERAEVDLPAVGQILGSMDTKGWKHFAAAVAERANKARSELLRGTEPALIYRAQGVLETCDWILGLPESYAALRNQLSDLTRQSGVDDTEGVGQNG